MTGKYSYISLNLSEQNSNFAPLAQKGDPSEPQQWLNVPNKALPAAMSSRLQLLFEALYTGTETDEPVNFAEENTILAQFKKGALTRVFGPCIYRTEGPTEAAPDAPPRHLVIRWGNRFIPIVMKNGEFFAGTIQLLPTRADVGRYNEVCFQAVFDRVEAKEEITLNFPIKLIDGQDSKEKPFNASTIASMAKREPDTLLDIVKTPSGGGGATCWDMIDLPSPGTYSIIDAIVTPTKAGYTTHKLLIKANPEAGLDEDRLFWSKTPISNQLFAGAIATADTPLVFGYKREANKEKPDKPYHRINIEDASYESNGDEMLTLSDW